MTRVPRTLLRLALGIVGIALVALLIARLGPQEITKRLAGAGEGLLAMLMLYAAGTAAAAMPWRLLLTGTRLSNAGAIASRFSASAANALLPVFGVGGEPTRLLWLEPEARARGIAALVVDRVLFLAASALFLGLGVAAFAVAAPLERNTTIAGGLGALTLCALAGAAAYVAARHRPGRRVHALIARLSRGENGSTLGEDVDQHLGELWRSRRRLAACTAIFFAARLILGAEIVAGFYAIGVPITAAEALALAAVPVALSIVASWIPSQLGVQEGGLALVCTLVGLDPSAGVTVVLLQRIRQIASIAIGWLLLVSARRRS